MKYSFYSTAVLCTIAMIFALPQGRLFSQGTVQIDMGSPSNSIDLSSGGTIIFDNATGPGDAATATISSNMSWTGPVIVNSDGRFQITGNYGFYLNGPISGSGNMILDSGADARYTVGGDLSEFTGDIYWNHYSPSGSLAWNGLNFGNNIGSYTGNIYLNRLGPENIALNFDVNSATTYSGIIFGDDTIVLKSGSGTLTLSNAGSDFQGEVHANGGILQVLNDNFGSQHLDFWGGIFDMSDTKQSYEDIHGTGTILLGNNGWLTTNWGYVDGIISGSDESRFTKTGTGDCLITRNAGNNFQGMVDVNNGTLQVQSNNFGSSLHVNSGATYNMSGTEQRYSSLSGSGTIVLNDYPTRLFINNSTNCQFDGVIEGARYNTIWKEGSATLDLSQATSHYTGEVLVAEGTLFAPSNFGSELAVTTGGTFDMSGTTQNYEYLYVDEGHVLTGNNSSLTIGGGYMDWNSVISGSSSSTLTKTGSGWFSMADSSIDVGTIHVDQGDFGLWFGSSLTASNGMTVAPGATLHLGGAEINNTLISMQPGSKLCLEMNSSPTIATFNNSIPLVDPNDVFFYGISYLAPSETRTIEFTNIASPDYAAAIEDFWNNTFNKPLVGVNLVNPSPGDYTVDINAVSLSSFASSAGGFTQNQMMQIADMENERQDWNICYERWNTFEMLYNSSDAYNILQSLLTVTDETNEVADTITAFSLGQAALFGDIAFNSSSFWIGKNNQTGSQNTNDQSSNAVIRGQSPGSFAKAPILYFQPYYKSVKTDTRGVSEGYGIAKTGFLAGATIDTNSTTSVGILFGYANPRLFQNDRNVTMDDVHVGLMTVKSLPRNFDFGALVSVGWQEGTSSRYATGPDPITTALSQYRLSGDMSGYTFNATANLGKRIALGRYAILKPTVGFDYEGMWISSFTEKTANGSALVSGTIYDNGLSRRCYDDNGFDRVLFKVGVAGSLSGEKSGISGKVLYGSQLGGSDVAVINATVIDGAYAGDRRHYSSLPIGRDFVYLDGGLHRYVNQKNTALLYASYNTTLYAHTTEQTVLLGFQWMH